MTGLLDLPTEIRLAVIELVIFAERAAPIEYNEDDSRRQLGGIVGFPESTSQELVFCETDEHLYVPNAFNLLSVNHQLKAETEFVLKGKELVYKLDLAIMQGTRLWPTWTCIPAYARTVDIVETTIRGAGPGLPCMRMFDGGQTILGRSACMFLDMLNHFLILGAVSLTFAEVEQLPFTEGKRILSQRRKAINVLDLNFVDAYLPIPLEPSGGSAASSRCQNCGQFCRTPSAGVPPDLGATALYNYLVAEIFAVLRMELATHLYGLKLFWGVGKLRLRLRGALQAEVDLGEWLGKWPLSYEGRDERAWLSHVSKIRTRFGLHVAQLDRCANAEQWRDEQLKAEREAYSISRRNSSDDSGYI